MNDEIIARAEAVAREAHRGQVDKAGLDYIAHPRRVAANARAALVADDLGDDESTAVVAAAWLHDVVEDTSVTEDDLRGDFPAGVVDAVIAVTKRSGEDVEDYFARVRANPLAVRVKT
ncbi:phosphohydrolase, partial [Burkholderia multivorans]|uniref:HD domain-containing protein n=1 Tax=Burkholderia multivorans TaxID=87883 RepID=UPI000DAE3FAF